MASSIAKPGPSGLESAIAKQDVEKKQYTKLDLRNDVAPTWGIYAFGGRKVEILSVASKIRNSVVPESVKKLIDDEAIKPHRMPCFEPSPNARLQFSDYSSDAEMLDEILKLKHEYDSKKKAESRSAKIKKTVKTQTASSEFELLLKNPHFPSAEIFSFGPDAGCRVKDIHEQYYVTMPDTADVVKQKVVAVFFQEDQCETMHLAGTGLKNSQMTFIAGKKKRWQGKKIDEVWLKLGECAIFVRGEESWDLYFCLRYKKIRAKIHTQVYQGYPLIVSGSKSILTINDGELFLPEKLIVTVFEDICKCLDASEAKKAAKKEVKKEVKRKPFPWGWCTKVTLLSFLEANKGCEHVQFFYHSQEFLHTVGVFAIVEKERVFFYIHETLGELDVISMRLRDEIKEVLSECFKDKKNIVVMYPKKRLQGDYESCGVMALSAMRFFRKKRLSFTKCLKRVIGNVKPGYSSIALPVYSLHVDLLKFYQGNVESIDSGKRQQLLLNRQTLDQYLEDHMLTLESKSTGKKKEIKFNVAPLNARYNYMQRYDRVVSMTYEASASHASATQPVAAVSRRKRYTSTDIERAITLHQGGGKSWKDVKEETGVSQQVVARYEKRKAETSSPDAPQSKKLVFVPIPIPIPVPVPVYNQMLRRAGIEDPTSQTGLMFNPESSTEQTLSWPDIELD